jgi:hypothetical protein
MIAFLRWNHCFIEVLFIALSDFWAGVVGFQMPIPLDIQTSIVVSFVYGATLGEQYDE